MNLLSLGFGCVSFVLIARIIYRIIKNKRFPTSNYNPFDDSMTGIDPDVKHNNQIIKDTKHDIAYEERTTPRE